MRRNLQKLALALRRLPLRWSPSHVWRAGAVCWGS